MGEKQIKYIEKIKQLELQHAHEWWHYWLNYSSFTHWRFWVVFALLTLPLVALLFLMDKRKSLQIGFFGYSVHVFFTYIDAFGASKGYWFYPYKVFPVLPSSFSLDVSFVPVSYMLVYQWTLTHQKNYYVYMFGLSVVFSFIIKPIMEALRLFQFDKGANFVYLLLGYIAVGVIAKMITDFFLFLQKKAKRKETA